MTQSPLEVEVLARKFFDGIESGDTEGVSQCYAETATIWHNYDRKTQDRFSNLKLLKRFISTFAEIRYRDRKLVVSSDGFIQEHVLHVTRHDGRKFEIPAAIFCKVDEGQIVQLREYLDSVQVTALQT